MTSNKNKSCSDCTGQYPTYLRGFDFFPVNPDIGSLWKESCILPMHQALQLAMSSDGGYLLK